MHAMPSPLRRGLYAITPDEPSTERLLARVEPVLAAGAACLQYRNKTAGGALRHEHATALRALCQRHAVPLIINDDVELALAIGADGVHLGIEDGDLRTARERLGAQAIIGASCYDSFERASDAIAQGASYVAFGAFHPSPTKPHARRADLSLLSRSAALGAPRVAIGGITPVNARELVAAGADLVAVISGVFDARDPAAAVKAYLSAFEDASA